MLGVVLVLVALFIVGPIALFVAGALWSMVLGFFLNEEADKHAANGAA